MDWSIIIFQQLCLICRVQASMVLIWEMSFWTHLAPYRRSVCVKYIISFFFWIKKKTVFPCVWFLVGIYISFPPLETLAKFTDKILPCGELPVRLQALAATSIQFILHWTNSDLFLFVFHPFLSCSTLPFLLYNSLHSLSSPCPLFIFARQIKKMAWSFLCNLWNDSKEIFQNISKISVISTAMHFKLFFFPTVIKMSLCA